MKAGVDARLLEGTVGRMVGQARLHASQSWMAHVMLAELWIVRVGVVVTEERHQVLQGRKPLW